MKKKKKVVCEAVKGMKTQQNEHICVPTVCKITATHRGIACRSEMQDGDVGVPIWQEAVAWLHKI